MQISKYGDVGWIPALTIQYAARNEGHYGRIF